MVGKGIVEFAENKCKGCELCLSVCPKKIISIHKSVVNAMGYHVAGIDRIEECIACANCALMCPDGAISVFNINQRGHA